MKQALCGNKRFFQCRVVTDPGSKSVSIGPSVIVNGVSYGVAVGNGHRLGEGDVGCCGGPTLLLFSL